MKFIEFLSEMFEKENGYKTTQRTNGKDIIFDILTEEDRDYRFIFKSKGNGIYVSELGFTGNTTSDTDEITGDFYDVDRIISTIVGIFTTFYLNVTDAQEIVYKFQRDSNKSYRLLINSIFKKELSNYFNIITLDNDDKNFDNKKFLIVRSNRANSPNDLTLQKITKLLK